MIDGGTAAESATTEGRLLNGRLIYRQPASGFRSGLEPVLLAASIPARAGECVLEAGTGAGAALLCLHARIPGLRSTGIETIPEMAALAKANATANGFDSMSVITGALEATACLESAGLAGSFDHVLANPPYHAEDGTPSPVAAKETAKRGSAALVRAWVGCLSGLLRRKGTLTLILPTWLIPDCLAAMTEFGCAGTVLFPLWPKSGRAAKLVLLRGVKDSRSPLRLTPGLVMHQADGSFTTVAQTILRDGIALDLER